MEKIKQFALRAVDSVGHLHPNILFAAGIMPLALVLGFIFLGDKSLSLDESVSVTIAQMDLPQFWHVVTHYEANQGFYYFLLHLWLSIGQNEFIVRSLSAIFAAFSVAMVYIFGTRLFGARVGIIAALLITVNAFFIAYAQEARSYILAILLATMSSFFFIKSVENPNWKWQAAYVLSSVLGVYAHMYVVLVLIAQFASLIFLPRREIPWKGLAVQVIVMAALLIPMGLFALTRDIGQIEWVEEPRLVEIAWLFSQLAGRGGLILGTVYLILGLVTLIFIIKMFFEQGLSVKLWRHALLLSWLLLPIIISFLFSYIKPVFVPRYLLISLPPLVFLVAIGLSHIKKSWLLIGCIGVVIALSCFPLLRWYTGDTEKAYNQKDDWRGITSYILSSAEPGDAIVFYHPITAIPFDYYRDRLDAPDDIPTSVHYLTADKESLNFYYLPEGFSFAEDLPLPDRSILERLDGHDRVWLVRAYTLGPENEKHAGMILGFIQERYVISEEDIFPRNIRVFLFELKNQ